MDKPKLITVIESNGEIYREGDVVNYTFDNEARREQNVGRITKINKEAGGIIFFDCSERHQSKLNSFNVCYLASISHVAEQED